MSTRRGFLKIFSKGALAGAALSAPVAGYAIGVDQGKGDAGMFNFTCSCGRGFMERTPLEVGTKLELDCECGNHWSLDWRGDHFNTKLTNPHHENSALPARLREAAEEADDASGNFPRPWWVAIREFNWEEKLSDGTIYQHRLEMRLRSDGHMYYQGHNLHDGKKTVDYSEKWERMRNIKMECRPTTARWFNNEFEATMKRHHGTEVFLTGSEVNHLIRNRLA